MSVEYRDLPEDLRSHFVRQTAQAFNLREKSAKLYETIPTDEIRVLTQNGELLASLRLLSCDQYFGGQAVPCVGLAAVQVPPEARGRGFGKLLMSKILEESRQTGRGISVLYPSTMMFYRRLGYEIAGSNTTYSIPVTELTSDHPGQLTPWDESDLDEVRSCYLRLAAQTNGLMDLPRSWWMKFAFFSRYEASIYRYSYRKNGELKGFLTFIQSPEPSISTYSYSLICNHLVWTDSDSANAILSFARSSSSLAVNLVWSGPEEEALTVFCDRQVGIRSAESWMARLIDVTSAFESRGYPQALDAQVEFSVSDPSLPENEASYRLEAKGGSATLRRISKARIELDIRILSALYTGWIPAREAVRLGRLRHASHEEVDVFEAIFQGPKPWLDIVF